jgi:menaquinone reductase, multiheme cytochrome c subunit
LVGGPLYLLVIAYYGGAPSTTAVGYAPKQPVPYSHALHAGKLGIDCRYCHTTVENAAFAAVPPTQTCINCHATIRSKSDKLALVRESYVTGEAIPWVKVHDLADYVYFDHRAHVSHGVGCVECHGRVDKMEVVTQVKTLSMAWCLDCHRHPEPHLRQPELVTQMDWKPGDDQAARGAELRRRFDINPSQDCYTCHR